MERLSFFSWRSAGSFSVRQALAVPGGAWRRRILLPVGFGILVHPREGLLLVDTGMAPRALRAAGGLAGLAPRLLSWNPGQQGPAVSLLSELGFQPSEVRWILVTHFDYDHIAGLADFPEARIFCLPEAARFLEHIPRAGLARYRTLPELLPKDLFDRLETPQDLGAPRVTEPLEGWDLFGDGTVVTVELPGHAPGHMGVHARAPDRDVFMVGDAIWTMDALSAHRDALAHRLIAWDRRSGETTRQRLADFQNMHPEVELVPTHCWEPVNRQVPHFS